VELVHVQDSDGLEGGSRKEGGSERCNQLFVSKYGSEVMWIYGGAVLLPPLG
jgi:hypothetical protein